MLSLIHDTALRAYTVRVLEHDPPVFTAHGSGCVWVLFVAAAHSGLESQTAIDLFPLYNISNNIRQFLAYPFPFAAHPSLLFAHRVTSARP